MGQESCPCPTGHYEEQPCPCSIIGTLQYNYLLIIISNCWNLCLQENNFYISPPHFIIQCSLLLWHIAGAQLIKQLKLLLYTTINVVSKLRLFTRHTENTFKEYSLQCFLVVLKYAFRQNFFRPENEGCSLKTQKKDGEVDSQW